MVFRVVSFQNPNNNVALLQSVRRHLSPSIFNPIIKLQFSQICNLVGLDSQNHEGFITPVGGQVLTTCLWADVDRQVSKLFIFAPIHKIDLFR